MYTVSAGGGEGREMFWLRSISSVYLFNTTVSETPRHIVQKGASLNLKCKLKGEYQVKFLSIRFIYVFVILNEDFLYNFLYTDILWFVFA